MRTKLEALLPTDEGEIADNLNELVEALTAVGNYLSAAHNIVVGRRRDPQQVNVKVLESALREQERAVSALVRLRASLPLAER